MRRSDDGCNSEHIPGQWDERREAPPTPLGTHNPDVDDERPPICPTCGVTMVPAALSAHEQRDDEWICLECEETDEPDLI
jgi:hypothetical protein